MVDPNWFCLFNTDLSDKTIVKGNLRVKLAMEDFSSLSIDKSDTKRVNLVTQIDDENIKISIILENSKKATECHEYLQYNLKQCTARTCDRIQSFLLSHFKDQ